MDRERGTVTVADRKEQGQSDRGSWIGTETLTQETTTGDRDRYRQTWTEIRKGTEGEGQWVRDRN